MALLVMLVIGTYRVFYLIRRKRKRKLTATIHTLISKFINQPDKRDRQIIRLEKLITKKWHKQLLMDAAIQLSYDLSGNYRNCAVEMYKHFHLDKISNRKLKSKRWDKVIEGIIELSIMQDKEAYPKFLKLLDHPRFQVRKEAKIAIVELERTKGLIDMKERIGIMSEWTFISILAILHRTPFKLKESQINELKTAKNPATRRLAAHLDTYSVAY